MSTPQIGQLIPGSLPTTCYPQDVQTLYNLFCQLSTVQFPGLTGVIISDTQPVATDRDKAWLKTSGTAPLWPPVFIYFNGKWVARHPVDAGASERRLWVGLEADLTSYDGGDGNAPGDASGPMWAVDHTFDARFLVAPGTLPSTTMIAVNGTGGEETHVLTTDEMPSHNHPTLTQPSNGFLVDISSGGSGTDVGGSLIKTDLTTGNTGGDKAHNNLPPYIGVFVIKRTGRVYYLGA